MNDRLSIPECEKCFDEEGSYSCVRPAHQQNMRITYELSYAQLDSLGADEALVPLLRTKGMPVYLGHDKNGRVCIKTSEGIFGWTDSGSRRTFYWEGQQPVKSAEENIVCSCGSTTLLMEYGNLRCVSCNRIIPKDQIFIPGSSKAKQKDYSDATAEDRAITFDE